MDANRLVLLLVLYANLCLGVFVYLKDRRNAVNISFFALTTTIALWIFGVFMIVSVWRHSNPIFWARLTYALGTFMAAGFAAFSIVFPYGRLPIAKKYILSLCLSAVIFAGISLSPLSIKEILYENGVMVKVYYGIGNVVWALYVLVCLGLAFYSLGRKWRRERGIRKLQIQYMSFGIVLTTTLIALTNIFIPLILEYEEAGAYGPIFTMIMVGCIAYAIVKHRLMDIRVFIRKGIIYSALLAGATFVVGLIVIGIPYAFPALGERQSLMVSLLGGAFMIFVVRPFSQGIKDLVNTFIFKDHYHYQRALSKFARQAVGTLDMDKLLNLIFDTAVKAVRVDRASLWFLDPKTGTYNPVILLGFKPNDLQTDLSTESRMIRYMKGAREPVVKEELERSLTLEDFDIISADFRRLKAEVSLPLFAEDRLIGILNLGNKVSGRIYYEEDVNLLKSIVDQSSIAIQNALLHQQIVNMKNYNEAVLENLTSGVIAIDSSLKITTINQAAAKILGLDAANDASVDFSYLPSIIGDLLYKTLKNGSGFRNLEAKITTMGERSGEKTILIGTTVLRNEKQEITGAIAVFSDISVLKAIEEDIRQAEKLSSLGYLAAELAHEIKNPLLTIKTSFGLLMEHQCEKGIDKEFLSLAMSETDKINERVRRLLDLARPAPPEFAWCNINEILNDVLPLLKIDSAGKNIELIDKRSHELPDVYADRSQLRQAFMNIGLNALEAMGSGGKLTIETSVSPISHELLSRLMANGQRSEIDASADVISDSVIVRISDTGKGIPKEDLGKIFEPFYTTKGSGTGLGLAIVRNIIREHKSDIKVDSHVGIGTTFTIEFPLIGEKVEIFHQ